MNYVVIVGGVNTDIQGFPKQELVAKDSNIGNVKVSLGGVGRNIAENLVRLGVKTRLISVLGDDLYGEAVLANGKALGLNMDDTLILSGEATSIYLSILDKSGDMELAISSMDIFDNLDIDFIESKRAIIESSKLCIIDANILKDTIEYMVTKFKGVDFFLDTVSTAKTKKIKDLIGNFHTIKPNELEAEILTGIKISNDNDLIKASNILHEKGVKKVFITLGEKGVFYSDGEIQNHLLSPKIKVTNATGAGDAFVAALAYGYMKDIRIDEVAKLAMYASIVALSYEDTINKNMSIKEIESKMEELKQC